MTTGRPPNDRCPAATRRDGRGKNLDLRHRRPVLRAVYRHLGFAMRTPVVALFGTISPKGTGPYEIPDHLCRIIKIDLEERDYVEESDPGEFHFRSITVDKVWEQVEKVLAGNSSS